MMYEMFTIHICPPENTHHRRDTIQPSVRNYFENAAFPELSGSEAWEMKLERSSRDNEKPLQGTLRSLGHMYGSQQRVLRRQVMSSDLPHAPYYLGIYFLSYSLRRRGVWNSEQNYSLTWARPLCYLSWKKALSFLK